MVGARLRNILQWRGVWGSGRDGSSVALLELVLSLSELANLNSGTQLQLPLRIQTGMP